MTKGEQKIFDAWFNFYKDKTENDIKRGGSNRDQAFSRGYIGFKLKGGDGNPYVKTSPLRIVYNAGKKVKKYHKLKEKK